MYRCCFNNTIKGIHEFIQTVSAPEHHYVLETTATARCSFVCFQSKHYRQPLKSAEKKESCPCDTQTDEIDARLITL